MTAEHELELLTARTALCDLLTGRSFRWHAAIALEEALHFEQIAPAHVRERVVDTALARAAHMEWTAMITEQGIVQWGERRNRCGSDPEYESA